MCFNYRPGFPTRHYRATVAQQYNPLAAVTLARLGQDIFEKLTDMYYSNTLMLAEIIEEE